MKVGISPHFTTLTPAGFRYPNPIRKGKHEAHDCVGYSRPSGAAPPGGDRVHIGLLRTTRRGAGCADAVVGWTRRTSAQGHYEIGRGAALLRSRIEPRVWLQSRRRDPIVQG